MIEKNLTFTYNLSINDIIHVNFYRLNNQTEELTDSRIITLKIENFDSDNNIIYVANLGNSDFSGYANIEFLSMIYPL